VDYNLDGIIRGPPTYIVRHNPFRITKRNMPFSSIPFRHHNSWIENKTKFEYWLFGSTECRERKWKREREAKYRHSKNRLYSCLVLQKGLHLCTLYYSWLRILVFYSPWPYYIVKSNTYEVNFNL